MAGKTVRVSVSYKGIGRVMWTRPVLAKLRETSKLGATIAKGVAPKETGFYRRSITSTRHDYLNRPAYRFGSDDPKAHLLEWGYEARDGSHQPGQRVLGLAAELLGGRRRE